MASNLKCTDDLDDTTVSDGVFNGSVETTDNTPTLVAVCPIPADKNLSILARIVVRRTDSGADMFAAAINCGFSNTSGTVTQVGATVTTPVQVSAGVAVTVSSSINGSNVEFYVTGEVSKTYNWRFIGQYMYI